MNEQTIEESELMWCAGLLEGEGSFSSYIKKARGREYPVAQLQCGMHQRDRDVLERLQKNLGGTIVGPYPSTKSGQDNMLTWGLYRLDIIRETINILYPHLGARRKAQCDKALDYISRSAKYGK